MLGSVQISGEDIGDIEVRDICESLRGNSIRLLSLRGCGVDDANFRKLMESIKETNSLVHLNLNLGVINSRNRVLWLADGVKGNESLNTLLLHGNPIVDDGMSVLSTALEHHPNIQTLDVGDCELGDDAITSLCSLFKYRSNKKDLLELTLTGNRNITQTGWAQFTMALAHGTHIKGLFLDYNLIGDFGAGMFAVALAAMKNLETLDLEGTGITNAGADLLCDSIESYNVTLRELNLAENEISQDILNEIKECLNENTSALTFQK